MKNTIMFVIGCLMVCALVSAQEQSRVLKGGGHLLGETAGQFFSEGFVGDILRACHGRDWKGVSQLSKDVGHASKRNAKDYCAKEMHAKQQATSRTRLEYDGHGDEETMRADTLPSTAAIG